MTKLNSPVIRFTEGGLEKFVMKSNEMDTSRRHFLTTKTKKNIINVNHIFAIKSDTPLFIPSESIKN